MHRKMYFYADFQNVLLFGFCSAFYNASTNFYNSYTDFYKASTDFYNAYTDSSPTCGDLVKLFFFFFGGGGVKHFWFKLSWIG